MFVKCPQCHTAYRIENKTLPPEGSKMRCAKCRHVWRAFPDPETGTSPEMPLIEPEAFRFAFSRDDHIVREPVNTFPQPPQRNRFGTVLFLLILVTAAAVVYFGRRPIINAFPQTAAFYQKLDRLYNPSVVPLKITSLVWGYEQQNRRPAIRLRGEIANFGEQRQPIPSLRISLYDNRQKLIRNLTVIPTAKTIAPESRIRFQTVFAAPETPVRQIYAVFDE